MKQPQKDPPHGLREKCEHHFDLNGTEPVFTYGDTIYNPYSADIDESLFAHEATHTEQQGEDPEGWWVRYFKEPEFRFEQELQAYRVQYRVIKTLMKDRNRAAQMLVKIASDLSSPMYGSMCSLREAKKQIQEGI